MNFPSKMFFTGRAERILRPTAAPVASVCVAARCCCLNTSCLKMVKYAREPESAAAQHSTSNERNRRRPPATAAPRPAATLPPHATRRR